MRTKAIQPNQIGEPSFDCTPKKTRYVLACHLKNATHEPRLHDAAICGAFVYLCWLIVWIGGFIHELQPCVLTHGKFITLSLEIMIPPPQEAWLADLHRPDKARARSGGAQTPSGFGFRDPARPHDRGGAMKFIWLYPAWVQEGMWTGFEIGFWICVIFPRS